MHLHRTQKMRIVILRVVKLEWLTEIKKDLRKKNPVIAGGIFSFLFDDDFL